MLYCQQVSSVVIRRNQLSSSIIRLLARDMAGHRASGNEPAMPLIFTTVLPGAGAQGIMREVIENAQTE